MVGTRTEEVEVQEDLVPRQENFPVSVFHRLQERVDHLRGLSNQLLKQSTNCSRGGLGNGPLTRSFNMFGGFALQTWGYKNMSMSSRGKVGGGSEPVIGVCDKWQR